MATVNVPSNIKTLFPGLYALIISLTLSGQNLGDLKFELLDEMKGLSNHWVIRAAVDSNGFLWIGTRDGLNRYDGHQFKIFRNNPADSNSLQNDHMQFPYVDSKGRIWISYFDGGISLFNEECQCFTNFYPDPNKKDGLPATSMQIIHTEGMDTLFLNYWRNGIGIFNITTGKFSNKNLPDLEKRFPKNEIQNYNTVNTLSNSGKNFLWAGTSAGLYKFIPSSASFIEYMSDSSNIPAYINFTDIVQDGEKGLWLGTYGGGICYFQIENKEYTYYKYKEIAWPGGFGNLINYLLKIDTNRLLLATPDEGLGLFNIRDHNFTFLKSVRQSNISFNPNSCNFIQKARDHSLFAGIDDGLLAYHPLKELFHFKNLNVENAHLYRNLDIRKILTDPTNNSIYFALGAGNGFNVLDLKTNKLKNFPIELYTKQNEKFIYLIDMVMQKDGPLWLASRNYLFEYDRINRKLEKLKNIFQSKEEEDVLGYSQFQKDPKGNIWMLSTKGGLYKFDPGTKKFSHKINTNISGPNFPKVIQNIAFDQSERIWLIGKNMISTYCIPDGTFSYPFSNSNIKLIDQHIQSVISDHHGNIYITQWGKGILFIDNSNPAQPKLKWITKADGLISDKIFSLGEDYEGNIWMSCTQGIVFYKPSINKFKLFNQASGMDKNSLIMEFIRANDETKEFYLATDNRYCLVDFEKLNFKSQAPKVYLSNFTVLNKDRPIAFFPKNPLILKPGENYFSIEFSCIDFQNQLNHRFSYMLEGWDQDWIQCGNRRFASYTNLNGGNYTFKVKVANGDGIWSETLEIPIIIEIPFYKKSWFTSLIALLFALLIYAFYVYRINQIEQAEKLKTEFNKQLAETRMMALRAQMNPHFIFNCLNSINRYIIKSDIQTASMYITRFAKLIRLILDNSEFKKVVLTNELEALKLYIEMEALRFDHKFQFEIEVNSAIDSDQIEIPSMLIQPFVENAIWHGLLQRDSGGHLSIQFDLDKDLLVCTIEDNGIGRAKAQEYKSKNAPTRKSIGMKLTEERLNNFSQDSATKASQEIIDLYDESGEACGTRVILKIPI